MRRFAIAASFLAVSAFSSLGSLEARGPGGGHGGGGHSGGGHGGEHAGGAHGSGEHGNGDHGRPAFAGGPGASGNSVGSAALASKLANGQTPLNGGSTAGLGGNNPLAGNPSAAIGRLGNGGLNNGAGLGGLMNGLNPQQRRKLEEQLLHKRLIEAHKLAQLAKQSNDPKLLAQAQQMAQQVEQQFAKEFGSLPNGAANHPGITVGPATQGLNNVNNTSGGNGFFPPGNLAGGREAVHAPGQAKR